MALAVKMPKTPEELRAFVREVVDQQVGVLQQETLAETRRHLAMQTSPGRINVHSPPSSQLDKEKLKG